MAARAPGWAERGAARGALPTPVRRPASEGRGQRARPAARGALESSPRERPRSGAVCGRERGPPAQARGVRKPLRHRGGGGARGKGPRPRRFPLSPAFSRKARDFPFLRFLFVSLYFDHSSQHLELT